MPTLRLTGLHALVRLALVRLDACCKKRAGAVCREQRHILLVCARRGVIFWAQSSYQPSRLSGGRQWTKMSALITRRTARSWCAPSACRVTSSTSSAPATQALLLQATSAGMLVEVLQPPGAAGAGAAGAGSRRCAPSTASSSQSLRMAERATQSSRHMCHALNHRCPPENQVNGGTASNTTASKAARSAVR